jgi:hypothetical protein
MMLGKHTEWPAGGPNKWLTDWQELVRDCDQWCPALSALWASDFRLVWGDQQRVSSRLECFGLSIEALPHSRLRLGFLEGPHDTPRGSYGPEQGAPRVCGAKRTSDNNKEHPREKRPKQEPISGSRPIVKMTLLYNDQEHEKNHLAPVDSLQQHDGRWIREVLH